MIKQMARDVDVPDRTDPILPEPADYKIARRDLAVVFRNINAEPGRFELDEAKAIIDRARDNYRAVIHKRIAEHDFTSLIIFCVEQHDALVAEYHRTTTRVEISLAHEVNYSRADSIAKAYNQFTQNARNYRYIIESALSISVEGGMTGDAQITMDLVASVDWLFTLYGASDVLHNGIHPGGINLDQHYVPEVFFSGNLKEKEEEFSLEQAHLKLGVDLTPDDEVRGLRLDAGLEKINQAFRIDTGFTLTNLAQCLVTLSRWPSARGSKDLKLSYQASKEELVETFCRSAEGLANEDAQRIVEFITIDPSCIRRLLGKDTDESDVPVWEHNKRAHRLTIRPLIQLGNDNFVWGAASAERAGRIWTGSVSEGYLPADFGWQAVKGEVRNIKERIEKSLEKRAFEICSRTAQYVIPNIDFMRRFRDENFDDVGDFDVLAYWPDTNRWLMVECKYNHPPFCLKDARRLRDHIFGAGSNLGHFGKIERRRKFLQEDMDRIREALKWPTPSLESSPSIISVYVSREIYWWMRNPPYGVHTQFVRIDALDGWLQSKVLEDHQL